MLNDDIARNALHCSRLGTVLLLEYLISLACPCVSLPDSAVDCRLLHPCPLLPSLMRSLLRLP
ncbi:hypothetical protein PR003_g8524 [Phytophthora rubi]|uniref:Uncharacterized protein n=1 Tax=Phytophthora rubi TaxID=129364 RepID=A0A6A3N0E5_9STRA|nr:hypothetical protein PR001_g8499 [Phytophthora rubi]KAE9344327.1 hypothetical protein PR003_g8524 [Phytophthora rubi]